MPASYTIDTLPKPKNPAVKLKEVEAKRFAVICFSGMAGEDSLKRHTDELEAYLRFKNCNHYLRRPMPSTTRHGRCRFCGGMKS